MLAEKALRNYIGDTRQNLEHMISKALHGIPNSTYKDAVLNKVLPILIRFVDTVYDKFDMVVRFTDDAHYDPHAFQGHGEIQIPLATALHFVLKNTVYKNVMADTAGTTEFKFGQKERYYADRLIDMYLPAILNALLWHEASHMLLDKVYHFGGSLKSYCDKLVDTFIDITGMKIPNDGNPVYRDEIFAIGMEMAIHYMDTIGETDSPVLKILADIASRSHLNGTYATKLVAALYSSHITSFIGSPDLRVNPEKGNKDPGLKAWESAIRNNWQKIYQSEARPKAVVKYAKLIDLMTGGIPAGNNALTYAIAVMTGMASDRSTISEVLAYPRHIANYYSDVINSEDVRTFFGEKVNPVSHVHKRLARIFGITSDELTQLIPDIDTHIQDDIAILQLEFQARSQAETVHFPYNSFEAMNTWLESSLLSSSEADTGAEAQSETPKLQQDNAANGQPKMKTPAQEANAAVEETKTKGEQEKLKETANTLANVNSKLEDKTPEQQAAEKRASDLTTQAVSEIKKGETAQQQAEGEQKIQLPVFTSGKQLEDLSLTSPYIQEITDSINTAIDKNASYTQYNQLKFMLSTWLNLIKSYGDWLGQNLLRGDVSSNDLMHILDDRLDYARYHSNERYSDSQIKLMAAWLNNFITSSKLGSAIKQAYTGKDWERDDNIIIENSDGTRKVEERQFLSDFNNETISRIKAAEAAKAAAAKAKADAEAAEAAKAAADAKARALPPDEISEKLEKPAPLSPREQQDWKLETELDDQLNIFNRPNKEDTDNGVENAEDAVGHTNANIDENSAAVKVAVYLRMATGDVDDDAVSQWLGFLFENGWGLKKLLLARTRNKEKLHMTLADFRQVMLDGEIDADVVEKIIYALDNYTNLFAIIETHHPDFRTAPANKQLGKYLGDYAESDRIQNLSERNAEIADYKGTKEDIISDISGIIDDVYTVDTSITAEDMETEDEADSNDTDSGVRYYASEAEDMTEDEAQQTIDESTSSESDPEIPEDKSEALDETLDDDSGQTQQTAQDDEDSSEPAEPETGAAIDPDAPETFGELDITFSEVLDQYFTPDEQKQMAPDLAKAVAKLDRVVKTYGVYRRAFMEQMRNAFDASRIFRENHYVRNWANHFIDNWDRSTASLETWAIETYQGKVAPEDNPIVQSILLARRIGSSFTEAVNDILQRGMTMNENGDRVRMLDEKGQPVESVLEATTRMYKKLRDLGLRRDVLDTKENFRKDIGMFRTLLHTIERNEFKYEELKQQYAELDRQYSADPNDRLLAERNKVGDDIRHFEQMMRAESFDNISMDADYTLPMGGRTIAMARKELDSLYKKYDAALSDAGVRDASERHAIIQEMVVSFNIAYQHAIEEMDLLSARSGFFSEHTILQRHNFKYYTPLRQDIGDGRGSTIQAAKGSTTPAIDAISNYCMEAIRRTGAVTRNVIGMALNDAYENLYADYESTHRNANATPEEKMRVISHQSVGRGISVNGLLRLRKDEWSRIPADDKRFARFKQQAIFVELVRPTTAEERAAGLMDDTQLERMWIGFDPDIIGRARKSAPGNLKVSQQTATLHGIQNDIGADPDKPGYILYPEVEPRDYSDVGKALVDIAYEPNAKMGNFLKTCGFLTRAASEAMTTFNLLFALKSAISDFRERVTRLGRKEFVDSNGHKVSGVRIALRMWRNMLNPKLLGTVGKYSIELAAHKETKNDTQYRKYLAEMHKYGIIGGVQQQMVATGGSRRSLFGMNATEKIQLEIEKQRALQEQQTNKEAETLVAKLYRILGDLTHGVSRTRIGKFLHAVHNGAIGWSNMFYNVPLAAQYIAMRECGLSAQSAAADTAKAMDFTNRGYYHKVGGKFISFLTSITHGTANMMDSYGINRNSISSNPYLKQTGYARRMNMQSYAFKAARLSAYIGLVQVLMYAVGACLRPDEPDKRKAGQQLIDNMPLRSMYFLPVPILQWLGVSDPEGFVFKLAGGFGEDRLALNLAWGLDRYSRGKATMSEIAGSYMVNFVTNAAPADLPDFSPANNPARYMAYSAGHSIPMVAWLVDAALNITYSGKTLSSEFSPAMGQRAYEEHNAYIDIAYKDLSKTLYDTLGMNISPSTLKSMYEGIGYGPVVQGLMQLALHINDEVPRSRLDPDWAAANVNAIAKFFGATSLGNKMPDKPYVFIKQLRSYYEGLFRAAGVSSLLKANGSGTKAAAIQQTMRMMGMTPAEIADRVNMHDLDNKLTGILKQENALIDLRRSNGISVDQFTKRMNVLIRQANKLQSDFMKSSYYYRGIYGKRAGIPDKYRARLERENRLDAIRRANKELDK